jgi:hypothetical protein
MFEYQGRLLTWASDTSAYFVGRQWGRRKLIPRVSPGKTVEGSLGALIGTVGVALLYSEVLRQYDNYRLDIGAALVLGLLVSVAAQIGDLVESLLKREAGVKDSGALLPGHGGLLDRLGAVARRDVMCLGLVRVTDPPRLCRGEVAALGRPRRTGFVADHVYRSAVGRRSGARHRERSRWQSDISRLRSSGSSFASVSMGILDSRTTLAGGTSAMPIGHAYRGEDGVL